MSLTSKKSRGTIRGRVARILALPALVVLLLLGFIAAGQVGDFRSSQRTARSVDVALALQDLTHQLQTERGITAAVLGGNAAFRDELAPARSKVDEQLSVVRRTAGTDADPAVSGRVGTALAALDRLATVRRSVDAGKAGRQATFSYFTARIAALTQVDVGLGDASDAQLRGGVATLQALQDLTEAMAQERAFLNGVFSAGGFGAGEYVQFADMRAQKQAALARFEQLAPADDRESLDFVLSTGAARVMDAFEDVAVAAADGRHITVNPQSWWSGLTTVLDDLGQLQEHVGSTIQQRAATVQQLAALRLGGLVGLVLLCFVLSAYLASIASRSITRPLAELATEADRVAVERLPAAVRQIQAGDAPSGPPPPVPVSANAAGEISQVATALDRLQNAAYGLAVEQAVQRRDTIESLANLGRRNQNLIRRQLGFITGLEREEVDPQALANLFELDHLATRMRRNAASLLVLVGASSPRQWSAALPVADVMRAALSEVEDYRRVNLRRVDDALVHGSVIGSIAHLMAELIENGLSFSPPDTDIELQGRRLPDGYLIAVTDQGMGMSAPELREANARLQGQDDFVAAPTRYLGHHVVGKLAAETGVRVELIPSPVTGVTARILLPESLLVPLKPVESGPPAQRSAAIEATVEEPVVVEEELEAVAEEAEEHVVTVEALEPLTPVLPLAVVQGPDDARPARPPVTAAPVIPAAAARSGRSPVSAPIDLPVDVPVEEVRPPTPFRVSVSRDPGVSSPMEVSVQLDQPGDAPTGPGLTKNGLRKRVPKEPAEARSASASASASAPSGPGQRVTRVIDLDEVTEYGVDEVTGERVDGGRPSPVVTAGFAALRDGLARGEAAEEESR
ncbi:nitrate- and nitrite sensing domain-containing protein [Spongisporangium articulatum]|uniref:histidine kinase n=1 Tax=Spongisporangium articulatum TaxID=3362603 RepID=A0ABW8AH89_9ACTN